MCPMWLLVALVVVGGAREVVSQCWEHPSCQELSSESNMMECIQLCHSDLTAETPVIPGNAHLQPAVPSDASSLSSQAKRSYSMEHFRWGKPSGRKRRPVKVFASSLEGGSSSEGRFPFQARRQLSSSEDEAEGDIDAGSNENQELLRARDSSKSQSPLSLQERKDRTYKMSHFRWGSPPASKRNGGFMKPWEEKPQGQLAKCFRNILKM